MGEVLAPMAMMPVEPPCANVRNGSICMEKRIHVLLFIGKMMLVKYQDWLRTQQLNCPTLYFLVGAELCLLREARDHIKKKWHTQYPDSETTQLSLTHARDWIGLFHEANHLSLFAENRCLEATWDKGTLDAATKTSIQDYLQTPHPETLIVVSAPQLKIKTLEWLTAYSHVMIIDIQSYQGKAFLMWIKNTLEVHGLKTEAEVPEMIQTLTEGNMLAAFGIIEKLRFLLPIGATCSQSFLLSHAEEAPQFQLYALTDACLQGDRIRALRILRQQLLHQEVPLIVWVLSQTLRQLLQLSCALQRNERIQDICKTLKIWSSQMHLFTSALKRLNQATLSHLLQRCHQLDLQIRTAETTALSIGLETLVLDFSQGIIAS